MVTAAQGRPQYSGAFIPEIWSSKLLVKFYQSTVLTQISNTEYSGEIKQKGDKVQIAKVPDIEIRDYEKGQPLQIQYPDPDNTELEIDQAKYFNFALDDIDKYQSHLPLIDAWSNDAAQQMKIAVERQVFADIYADAHADNKGTTAGHISGAFNMGTTASPVSLTKTNIVDFIVDAGTVLDEYDVPEEGRWMILPPTITGLIKKSEIHDASMTGDGQSLLRTGRLGVIDRFVVYQSNLIYSLTDTVLCYHAMCGQKSALSFAAQMTQMDTIKSEQTFATLVRGLNVYGYKVLKPEAMVDLYVTKA